MQGAAAPVSRHLPAAAGRIGRRAYRLQQHLGGRHAKGQHQRAIAIVGKEPVVAGTQRQCGANLQSLMTGGGNLEEDLLLPFEHDLAVVHAAREKHEPVHLDQLLRAKAACGIRPRGNRLRLASSRNCQLHPRYSPKSRHFLATRKTGPAKPDCNNQSRFRAAHLTLWEFGPVHAAHKDPSSTGTGAGAARRPEFPSPTCSFYLLHCARVSRFRQLCVTGRD